MVMPAAQTLWTADMVRALPDDGKRYEVVDGELLVSPSPTYTHQYAVMELYKQLDAYARALAVGQVIIAPADVELDPRTLVVPDLFVVPLAGGRRPRDWTEAGALLLVVEVLSPSTARYDRYTKRRRYQRERAPEYWIVDTDARLIERWRPDDDRPEILGEAITWAPSAEHAALTIDLARYFADVLDR